MSAKCRAIQHRHRYTYNAVVLPPSFIDSLNQSSLSTSCPAFYDELQHLISLRSTDSQVNHVKKVASSFNELLVKQDGKKEALRVIGECFRLLCNEYGTVSSKKKRFSLSRVALSCGLETEGWARPSPIVMEQCQEAFSCLYYLFQKFPWKFKDLSTEDSNVIEMALGVLISVLKSVAFSRDCLVAAGVSFSAALQVCLSDQELGLFIIEGIFDHIVSSSGINSEFSFSNIISKVPYRGDVCLDIRNLSAINRLCLIGGILTAVPRMVLNTHFIVSRENFNDFESHVNIACSMKTILYDGILPELCNYCENPTDSHFNFHAITVMPICLQQIKTSILANLTNASENYNPLQEDMDIQSYLCVAEGNEKIKSLQRIASDHLHLGSRCKGRYLPLALLTKRFGAKNMLDMSPDLLFEVVQTYTDDDVCCAAMSFLKCFLEHLPDEIGVVMVLKEGIRFIEDILRSNLNTYALPVLLEVDVDGIFPLLACISIGPSEVEDDFLYPEFDCTNMVLRIEQKVAVLVSLLKVSRSLALVEGDIDFCDDSLTSFTDGMVETKSFNLYALVCIKGIKVRILVQWLVLALTHIDESLRVDAAEFLFLNPKTSSLPSHLELSLVKKAVPLNMRSPSTGFQMKWSSLFRKFFSRVRTALERQVKQGSWQPHMKLEDSELSLCKGIEESVASRAEELFNFMRWLSCFLFFSCYPSAPYKRKIMAMELILIMINIWSVIPSSQESSTSISPECCRYPYSVRITSPDWTFLLVGSIIDSWDRLRESSFRILLHFPTPLPGISSEDLVQKVITWTKQLVCSPRVRESDAGALTLRLLFRKYVLDLGWRVRASVNVVCSYSQQAPLNGDYQKYSSYHPVMEYVESLIHWLDVAVGEGEKNLAEACKNSFVHGVLLTLLYTFEELDWNSDAVLCSVSEMRHVLEKLLDLVVRITSLALWVVSADAWYLPEDMDEMVGGAFLLDGPDEMDVPVFSSEQEDKSSKSIQDARSSDQIVMVGCWLAMKEDKRDELLANIQFHYQTPQNEGNPCISYMKPRFRKIPLPSYSSSGSLESQHPSHDSVDALVTATSEGMLDLKQLEKIGNHFLEVLLKMKHNGAIDKTSRLPDYFEVLTSLAGIQNTWLVESWMEQLMERTVAKGQIVDDLPRRSAGIPASFTAIFLSEPEGASKKLLHRALRWLIDVAKGSLLSPSETICTSISCQISSTRSGQETDSPLIPEMIATEKTSKIRDEGVVPTVHAFNVLRAAFNDTNLASDNSGFAAEALIVSIRSFSSSYWEIRNSACLAYTSLVQVLSPSLAVCIFNSWITLYPSLQSFLSNELKVATEALSGQSESNLAKVVHPSLCPMLILLSRLRPSTISGETGDDLDPFLFMPLIRKCSTQSNLRVRVLASRALTGLVSNEKLPTVLLNIASELPHAENQITAASAASISLQPTARANHASFNLIHGLLLHVGSLLDINCRNLADFSRKDQILGDLMKVLAMCSWVASPNRCPCPVLNCSFLRVLDHMLSIARSCHMSENLFAIRNLLLELSTQCLDVEASYGLPYYDPTIAELRQQAAASYLSCLFQASDEVGEDVLHIPRRSPNSMSLQIPEVENTEFLDSETRIIKNWIEANLQSTLMKLLELEKNHRCTYYILRIIFYWNLLKFQELSEEKSNKALYIGELDSASVLQLWDKLISLYKQKNTGYNESDQTERSARIYECITSFVNLIKQHSSSSEPVNMCRAAEESLLASGLLEQTEDISPRVLNHQISSKNSFSSLEDQDTVNEFAHQILEMWFTCIKLLEDEDDGIRQRLATDIQKLLYPRSSGTKSDTCGAPTQVENVIELSFDHLSSIFGHWIVYFDYLLRWVLDAANYVISKGDLVRWVFDKEIDNHHEEKLLISQLCCSHLEKLPITKSWAGKLFDKEKVMHYLLDWRMRFCHQLMSFAKDHIGKLGVDWMGGVGNHKDAFLPLYANLLGFYFLSNCIFDLEAKDGMHLLADVIELGKAIDPFLKNPLISNLYLLIVRLHEKFGASINCLNTSFRDEIWDDFDPYFLLR
ncbi:hypothetical protein DITRI_Ditri09bG0044500 [Diplodiscus trichospermus]